MPVSTQAHAFKKAFYDAAVALFENVTSTHVAFGHPGTEEVDDIVVFRGLRSIQEPGPMSTNRAREETLQLDIFISVARGGGPEQEEICSDRGYEILGDLENYVRSTDPTVGGTVRECHLASHESDGWTVANETFRGRNITILATFEAKVRITN